MTSTRMLEGKVAVVTGGSRGLGRGVVEALVARKVHVVAVALDGIRLERLASEVGGVQTMVADVADENAAGRILQDIKPDLLVLSAGAAPLLRPIHLHTWETFSRNWEVDAKSTFVWLRDALLLPMKPGSHVIVVSSGAAVHGSPLSGGYAGAKRTQWMIADYAAKEAARLKLDLRLHVLLPSLNPNTDLGRAGIAAYAERTGVSAVEFAERFKPALTPAIMGHAVVDLYETPDRFPDLAYALSGNGLVRQG